ncbi:hypothetical protein CLIB1423_06S02080 [[Candida] railenensis]|uniref:Uncharacterized protein n=1 Tax=[Candida] railenensis TaxID=45579 RepID=A0A9P0QPR8_9ASCO|nr:hypothetical protein CLIB1423_06S02080 [[Candida] railenensis]
MLLRLGMLKRGQLRLIGKCGIVNKLPTLFKTISVRCYSTPGLDKRNEIIHTTLQNNPQAILKSATVQKNNKGIPLKSAIILIFSTVVSTISFYVAIQIWSDKEEHQSRKVVFVPLWLNMNLISTSKYHFPSALKYLDNDFHQYIASEIELAKGEKPFLKDFQEVDVKYKVLEKLSSNRMLRKFFHLPIPIELNDDCKFSIWMETKCPTVSGIQVVSEDGVDLSWTMKPFNIRSMVESALIQAGLKLDRLERSQANQKVHEKASGKIHEVPINKQKFLSLNSEKDYEIYFTGEFIISKENGESNKGKLKYKGKIDFDHLMINRGVKLVELCIDFPEGYQDGSITRYKVI